MFLLPARSAGCSFPYCWTQRTRSPATHAPGPGAHTTRGASAVQADAFDAFDAFDAEGLRQALSDAAPDAVIHQLTVH